MNIATPTNLDKELIDVLIKRQEQHLTFFSALESIRWKFTSAFGLGALISLFVSNLKDIQDQIKIPILFLVIILCLAGIATQIRIYSLTVTIWDRILKIQKEEAKILVSRFFINSDTQLAMCFPRTGVREKKLFNLLSVGLLSCLIFSLIIGIVVFLLCQSIVYIWLNLVISLSIVVGLVFITYNVNNAYSKVINIPFDKI